MIRYDKAAGDGVPQAAVESFPINSRRYCTDTESQRQRLLERLRKSFVTTLQARSELDVMHPAARVQELRKRGYKIVTYWQKVDTGKAKHRVACYVLLAGSMNG